MRLGKMPRPQVLPGAQAPSSHAPLPIHLILYRYLRLGTGRTDSQPRRGVIAKPRPLGLGLRNGNKPSPERARDEFDPVRSRAPWRVLLRPFRAWARSAGFPRPSAWALLLRPFGAENRHRPRHYPPCPAENVGHDQLIQGGELLCVIPLLNPEGRRIRAGVVSRTRAAAQANAGTPGKLQTLRRAGGGAGNWVGEPEVLCDFGESAETDGRDLEDIANTRESLGYC